MVEEITEKRKMTKEVKDQLNKRIFHNCLLAIGLILYICAIDATYIYINQELTTILMKVFPMILISVTIIIFELAYRKDSGRIMIVGIEFFVVSIVLLYLPKIYANLDKKLCVELAFIPIFCALYYMVKSILIGIKTKKEYENSLSDVKEIVKEET